jgi:threonine dehydratase
MRAADIVAEVGGNVLEVRHERLFFDVPIKATQIDFILATEGAAHLARIIAALRQDGIDVESMSALAHPPAQPAVSVDTR